MSDNIYRWVNVAPGVDIKVELDRHIVQMYRDLDDGDGTTEVTGTIVAVTMSLNAIDRSYGE